jgi:lipopolysaccharide export LptBFGC system permease protein LptF
MWKLHRYYLRELVVNSAITFLVMFAVVLVSLVARGIQRSMGGGMLDAAKITLFWALDSFPHLVTIAFLLATVLTYARAAQDRELIAIRAAGISPRVPMAAAVMVGILLAGTASFANHYVIPEVHFQKYRVIADVVRNVFQNLRLGSDRIPILDSGFVLSPREVERAPKGGFVYKDCTIYCPQGGSIRKDVQSPIVRVREVSIPVGENSEYVRIVLRGVEDPITLNFYEGPIIFDLDIHDIVDRDRREDRDDDLRTDHLLAEVLRGVHPRPFEAIYTLFRRCCFSLMPALLAPIGFCIAEMTRERGRVMAILFGLFPLSIFYFGEVLGARALRATNNPWTAWTPALLLILFGLPLCWRQLRR